MIMGSVYPEKTTGEFMVKRLMAFIKECGFEGSDITVKTDQENVLLFLFLRIGQAKQIKECPGQFSHTLQFCNFCTR